ncbi:MAG: hypothetical protein KKE23_00170 [Nanoarchaeota archaeon]|nr:hypothetical protein [Nanoarchaeota archaeon]
MMKRKIKHGEESLIKFNGGHSCHAPKSNFGTSKNSKNFHDARNKLHQNKRGVISQHEGISPIMATILLVCIAIVAFVFVFVWSRGFSQESVLKFNGPIEDSCLKVSFDASISENNQEIYIDNMGDIPIYGFNIDMISGGQSYLRFVRPADGNVYARESDSLVIDTGGAEKASITPVLLGEGKVSKSSIMYICRNNVAVLK